ncbi:MAG: hypothetical protein ACXAB0_08990 [Candidatus Thorarchaeota archaeon]
MRIAIVDKYRCRPKDCTHECQRFCPRVRTGDETVIFPEGPDKPHRGGAMFWRGNMRQEVSIQCHSYCEPPRGAGI